MSSATILRGAPLAPISARVNVGTFLTHTARADPRGTAVFAPVRSSWRSQSFAELDQRSDDLAAGLSAAGLRRADRAALFVRPGIEFVALVFALFKLGAVPVLIDPGMGMRRALRCLGTSTPRAFIGVPLAHALRRLYAHLLPSVELDVCVGGRFPGALALATIARRGAGAFTPADTHAEDEAAILFTSGSTGPAKGVAYTHGNFAAQIAAVRALCTIRAGERDLACFPLFALFDLALGATAVFPRMDAARPARCDPSSIVDALQRFACTYTFGSPAIWKRVVPWCASRAERLPRLERAFIAGAPVAPALIAEFQHLLGEHGEVHTPYGATESLPVASMGARELLDRVRALSETGHGTCVGRAAPGIEIAVIAASDEPIERWSDELALAPRNLGEVCVRGPVVTHAYAGDAHATARAKIASASGPWHRLGDLGYVDDEERLWFCGRKAHALHTSRGLVAPVPIENVANLHAGVARSALVGVGTRGAERALLVVESRGAVGRELERSILDELRARSKPPPELMAVIPERVLFHKRFPVDARHNAKIQSEKLKRWAEERGA